MGIGFPELMVILVIIMIIFGAGKLPDIGSAFGTSIRNFKQSMKEATEGDLPENKDPAGNQTEIKAVAENAESLQNAPGTTIEHPVAAQAAEKK